MKFHKTMLFAAVALAGCSQQSPEPATSPTSPAVTTAPTEEQKPLQTESAPLTVETTRVTEQDPAVLAGATWTAKQCALTTGEGSNKLVAATNGPTRLSGYFIDPTDKPAGEFQIILKGGSKNYQIPAKTGWDRADVAEFFKIPDLAVSGYDVSVSLSPSVPAGKYAVDFMLDREGAKYFCESGKTLIVE